MKTTSILATIVFLTWSNLASPTNGQTLLTNGLVAHYPLNGNVNDVSGHNHNGTANNISFAQDRFGNANGAASLAGNSSSYITINTTNLNLPPNFSVGAWVNFTAGAGTENPRVFSTAGYELGVNTTAADRIAYFNDTTASAGAPTAFSSSTIHAGVWNHLLGVRAGNQLLLYVNGSLAGSTSITQPPDYSRGWIPAIGFNGGVFGHDIYAGLIDDIRIYRRALSASEAQQLFSETPPIVDLGISRDVSGIIKVLRVVTNVCPDTQGIVYTGTKTLNGTIRPHDPCDELDNLFSTNAKFQASWTFNSRVPDWRGLHNGTFKILTGTNVIASGSMSGSDGVGTHRDCEECAVCNHFEGSLKGKILQGPLKGGSIQASYDGLIDTGCTNIPAGHFVMDVDGLLVLINCLNSATSQ